MNDSTESDRLAAVLALHAPQDDPMSCLRHANRLAIGWRESVEACAECFTEVRQVCRMCGPLTYPCLTAAVALGVSTPTIPPAGGAS